jgi:phosphatidylglycerophosphate synthase
MSSNPESANKNIADRRPLSSRDHPAARAIAKWLANAAITPNQISVLSVVFAGIGAYALYRGTSMWLLLAALCIQLRLLCNLFDGMVALEGGKASAVGALYNEVPDRIADSLFIVAAGYGVGVVFDRTWYELGWLGALLAACTAYLRLLGASLGQTQDFSGPMAKQHRMAVLTLAALGASAEYHFNHTRYCLWAALVLIALGSALTCALRLRRTASWLKSSKG